MVSNNGNGDLAVARGYDYAPLEAGVAEQARDAARRIRESMQRSLQDIIAVGTDLLLVKSNLPHGQFLKWLNAEFGWTERTARNLMTVAERFGKSEMISDLHIQPTAAYLLAAPSTPDEARQTAVERAQAGERITAAVAKDIVARAKKKCRRRLRAVSGEKLRSRLTAVLERCRNVCAPHELAEIARQLRRFADEVEQLRGDAGPTAPG